MEEILAEYQALIPAEGVPLANIWNSLSDKAKHAFSKLRRGGQLVLSLSPENGAVVKLGGDN